MKYLPLLKKVDLNGNLLIDMMLGSNIYLVEKTSQYYESIEPKMKILASKLDQPAYIIPIGGSNIIGLWGYIEMFNELLSQKADELCEDICFTCGSGGTMSGKLIAYKARSVQYI
jgi:1-aminocyclopropane-1-carboxylate deaminase/D-cysteine desulfhydrase-like pyridoxal-dependent ACC family enzyme